MVPYCPSALKMKEKTVYLLGAIFFGLVTIISIILCWDQGIDWIFLLIISIFGCYLCLKWGKFAKKTDYSSLDDSQLREAIQSEFSVETEGKNWCTKYNHKIDYELVHEICEDIHPKGCANCENSTHYTFSHDSKWSWGGRGVGKRRNENG